LLSGSLVACSPSVSRRGYTPVPPSNAAACKPALQWRSQLPPIRYRVVGTIEVGDSGFSTDCDEQAVHRLLREEACGAGADIIDILKESRPDVLSTCYRVLARLLRLQPTERAGSAAPPAALASDARYDSTAVQARTEVDDGRQEALLIGAIVAGVVAGVVTGIAVSAQ
jgi:hypothetical protein